MSYLVKMSETTFTILFINALSGLFKQDQIKNSHYSFVYSKQS